MKVPMTTVQMIENWLATALSNLDLPVPTSWQLVHSPQSEFGDYATSLCLSLFKTLSPEQKAQFKSPQQLSVQIAEAVTAVTKESGFLQKAESAGPGFINLTLTSAYLVSQLAEVINQASAYGQTTQLAGKKVSVEYTDPNPFKELHLGHLYSNLIGEAIARVMEANGAVVWRNDFYGDTGLHVAKSVWGMKKKLAEENVTLETLAAQPISIRQAFLGKCYAFGVNSFEADETAKTEITHLNTLIHAVAQELHVENEGWVPAVDYNKFVNAPEFDRAEIKKLYGSGLKWSLEYFETLYAKLGTKFDGYYPESKVGERGYQVVKANIKPGLFEDSDGTIIYPGEKYGLHTRVFINKLGLPTYEAKDTGLAYAKYDDFKYDKSIIVVGKEVKEYFRVVLDALRRFNPALGNITHALTHGMVKLPEGKMSSRSGNVITVEGLFDQAKQAAELIITNTDLPATEKTEIAEKVGMASVKYALLKADAGNDVVFSFKESVSFSGNSGPYLQYTVARCNAVLEKSGETVQPILATTQLEMNPAEVHVIRQLVQLPETVAQVPEILSLHLLCNYCYELASAYNAFYNTHSILGNADRPVSPETKQFRLALTLAITCPNRM
jgi:arginyl-tRNA synthetase